MGRQFVEWDASCQHWLGVNFPGVPIHGDITKLDFTELEPVDILCGGFPCQPASAAGKRLGTADDRWLWPHFARAIGAIRPRYVVAENVPGLLSVNGGRAFAEVLRDLAALGYDAEWDGLSAGDVGSPQERERVWIVAYAGRRMTRTGSRDCSQPAKRL
jgi:DNA (cytosine-5)-methyltransferase 1